MDGFAWIGAASGLVGIVSVVAGWIAYQRRAQPIRLHTYEYGLGGDTYLAVEITNRSQHNLTITSAGYEFDDPDAGIGLDILLLKEGSDTPEGSLNGMTMGPGAVLTGLVDRDFVSELWDGDEEAYQDFRRRYACCKKGWVTIFTSVSNRGASSPTSDVVDLSHWPKTLKKQRNQPA